MNYIKFCAYLCKARRLCILSADYGRPLTTKKSCIKYSFIFELLFVMTILVIIHSWDSDKLSKMCLIDLDMHFSLFGTDCSFIA